MLGNIGRDSRLARVGPDTDEPQARQQQHRRVGIELRKRSTGPRYLALEVCVVCRAVAFEGLDQLGAKGANFVVFRGKVERIGFRPQGVIRREGPFRHQPSTGGRREELEDLGACSEVEQHPPPGSV